MIKNLSQLKKKLQPGARFQIIEHWKKEFIGQIREVSHLHSNGFHSKVLDDPQHWVSLANDGKDICCGGRLQSTGNFTTVSAPFTIIGTFIHRNIWSYPSGFLNRRWLKWRRQPCSSSRN